MQTVNGINILIFIIFLLVCYFALLMYFYFFQRTLIYFPKPTTTINPDYQKEKMHFITVNTQDNLRLKAIYQPAEPGRPTVAIFLGNANELGTLTPTLGAFSKQGYGILHVAYRGYSGNPGKPSEPGLYQDGRAAMNYLLEQKIPLNHILLYGESLGSGVAVQMASEYSVQGLILQAPFSSLLSVAQKHYPYIPSRWLLVDHYDSLSKIKMNKAPLFIYHGTQDPTVPYSEGERLFAAANQPKKMKTLPGLHHTDLPDVSVEVIEFLQMHTKA